MKMRVAVLAVVALSACGSMSGPDGGGQTGGGSGSTGGGSASTGGGTGTTGGGSATTGGGTGTTGGGSASTGGGTGSTGGGTATPPYEVLWDGGASLDGGEFERAYYWRGENGQRFVGSCAPTSIGVIWGTDLYTDDSNICVAAVHVGLNDDAVGGVVTIEIRPGASRYLGTVRNGVTSSDYPAYSGSYAFVGSDGGLIGNVNDPSPLDSGVLDQFTWSTAADEWSDNDGTRRTGICPPNGTASSLWGTDIYTDDSSICTAAVHVGVITLANGGTVTFEVRPGEAMYSGTTRNGVMSNDYAQWDRSFAIIP